ncbi:MAG: hypothetical protein MR874_01310 [Coriobacteriaceae bacterium]|uniref:hypothetical protein n=1 Tax=Tractidigestivibacter sp. TaxID=2847320 RepID=UPI002A81E803|nr:hypothetical protein [Tractidigestivibacter sp.]MCI6547633.1 hypothetical protein [Coriobacteriaceae bacterium]MCI6843386.1 hypothetical protein [Coriobacteriaceae bacterium]MDD7584297.1 hypothetical protein [Coriobacteriaceae bacterium]MDY4534512.1 hypothetical protein [Tractidigestivibacter sp.]
MPVSIRHLITRYGEDGHWWAESWVQIDALGICWCLWKKRVCIDGVLEHADEILEGTPEHAAV